MKKDHTLRITYNCHAKSVLQRRVMRNKTLHRAAIPLHPIAVQPRNSVR